MQRDQSSNSAAQPGFGGDVAGSLRPGPGAPPQLPHFSHRACLHPLREEISAATEHGPPKGTGGSGPHSRAASNFEAQYHEAASRELCAGRQVIMFLRQDSGVLRLRADADAVDVRGEHNELGTQIVFLSGQAGDRLLPRLPCDGDVVVLYCPPQQQVLSVLRKAAACAPCCSRCWLERRSWRPGDGVAPGMRWAACVAPDGRYSFRNCDTGRLLASSHNGYSMHVGRGRGCTQFQLFVGVHDPKTRGLPKRLLCTIVHSPLSSPADVGQPDM